MKISHNAYDLYTEEEGSTTHNLIHLAKSDRIFIEDLIIIARAVGASTMRRVYYDDLHHKKGEPARGYLHEDEVFLIEIYGGRREEYTLPELYRALGREGTSYPS
jgi:hypothetical protein